MPTPEETVNRIAERFGRHEGHRALHAKGTLCRGTFTPAPAAATLTRAELMQGGPVPATVRFSNGGGNPEDPDYAPDVRGLAVKLYGPGESRLDISAQTAPKLPVRSVEAFLDLLRATAPTPAALVRLPLVMIRNPRVARTLPANVAGLRPPAGYATCRYLAFHAFRWVAADGGARWVRYRWRPEAGVATLSAREAKRRGRDYLRDELTARLERGAIAFTLELQIASDGDDPDDPTAEWPAEREVVDGGLLEVTGLETERETGGDVVVFDPTRVPDGIELSRDPILLARSPAYSASVERRTGVGRPDRLAGT